MQAEPNGCTCLDETTRRCPLPGHPEDQPQTGVARLNVSVLFGQWRTQGGHKAEIDRLVDRMYVGVLWIDDVQVPSWWDENGDSINAQFSLVTKRRGTEPW